jgi:hypothetical protein
LIVDEFQLETVALVPLNATVPDPSIEPKFTPVMVTHAPTAPEVADKLAMTGACTTVKGIPLLAVPPTITTMGPDAAPLGTLAVILAEAQAVTVAGVPLKLKLLVPWVPPKLEPAMVTVAPTAPEFMESAFRRGGEATVKLTALLINPFTVTTRLPVVAPLGTGTTIEVGLQPAGVADVPLNVTVLAP